MSNKPAFEATLYPLQTSNHNDSHEQSRLQVDPSSFGSVQLADFANDPNG